MPLRFPLLLFLAVFSAHCAYKPNAVFLAQNAPPQPDYAALEAWAAHPAKRDSADVVPGPNFPNVQDTARIDVFFLHPTTYIGSNRSERSWNARIDDDALNLKTDRTSILHQASLFNGAGRVFAPRYRQAHLQSFYGKDAPSQKQALDLAYADVLRAFDYYLSHWNQGRPFILAGHSQGGRHLMYLLRDRIENTPLQEKLIASYIVGWPVDPDSLPILKPCESPDDLGCYCTWRTFERHFGLKKAKPSHEVCTNPILWTIREKVYASPALHKGAILYDVNVVYPNLVDAEVYRGILLCSKPKFKGSFFFRRKNYHIADLNFYYLDVRENARLRAKTYLGRH